MQAAKAAWEVNAGVVHDISTCTRQWGYTSSDYEEDQKTIEVNKKKPHLQLDTIFMKRRDEAFEYAKSIMHPSEINWVRVDFIWF